jgi:hypothetical protein
MVRTGDELVSWRPSPTLLRSEFFSFSFRLCFSFLFGKGTAAGCVIRSGQWPRVPAGYLVNTKKEDGKRSDVRFIRVVTADR